MVSRQSIQFGCENSSSLHVVDGIFDYPSMDIKRRVDLARH